MHDRAQLDVNGIPGVLERLREELTFRIDRPAIFLFRPKTECKRKNQLP